MNNKAFLERERESRSAPDRAQCSTARFVLAQDVVAEVVREELQRGEGRVARHALQVQGRTAPAVDVSDLPLHPAERRSLAACGPLEAQSAREYENRKEATSSHSKAGTRLPPQRAQSDAFFGVRKVELPSRHILVDSQSSL